MAAVDAGNFPVVFGVVAALAASAALVFARLGAKAAEGLVKRQIGSGDNRIA